MVGLQFRNNGGMCRFFWQVCHCSMAILWQYPAGLTGKFMCKGKDHQTEAV
jgi:hypothetical protein